jgi:Zn-dependent peptidase ImmA (M78 family)
MDELDVQQQARQFMATLDIRNIRNDLSVYLKAANAVLHKEELVRGESGTTMTRLDGKHIITVNSLENEVRQRFTICHEIGHIALRLPSIHNEVRQWSYAKRHINEIACDWFATELLMPYRMWLDSVPDVDPSHEVLEQMAGMFQCSYPAAASRYASLASIPCALVTMERGAVKYTARSAALRRAKAWISPRSTIPTGSVAERLRREGVSQIDSGDVAQDVWFDEWESGLDLTEIARHYRSSDTTLSLLWFDEEVLPEREIDRFGQVVKEEEGLSELTGEMSWSKRHKRK